MALDGTRYLLYYPSTIKINNILF